MNLVNGVVLPALRREMKPPGMSIRARQSGSCFVSHVKRSTPYSHHMFNLRLPWTSVRPLLNVALLLRDSLATNSIVGWPSWLPFYGPPQVRPCTNMICLG